MTGVAVSCVGVRHVYEADEEEVVALDGIDLDVPAGASLAVVGPSGSGKSTLLTLLAGLQRPTAGEVIVDDADLAVLSQNQLLKERALRIGVMAQGPARNLLPYCDAVDNIRFAQAAARSYAQVDLPSPAALLDELGLTDLAGQPVDRLSGGERQRVAVAVAIAAGPGVLLADEPTSQLDTANRSRVVDVLRRVTERYGTTVIAVTHDPDVASGLDRQIAISDGRIVGARW